MNPVQIARGIEKTATALVSELALMSREVRYTPVFKKKNKNSWMTGHFENHNQNYLAAYVDLVMDFAAYKFLLVAGKSCRLQQHWLYL